MFLVSCLDHMFSYVISFGKRLFDEAVANVALASVTTGDEYIYLTLWAFSNPFQVRLRGVHTAVGQSLSNASLAKWD